jgi:hypothetical protein
MGDALSGEGLRRDARGQSEMPEKAERNVNQGEKQQNEGASPAVNRDESANGKNRKRSTANVGNGVSWKNRTESRRDKETDGGRPLNGHVAKAR